MQMIAQMLRTFDKKTIIGSPSMPCLMLPRVSSINLRSSSVMVSLLIVPIAREVGSGDTGAVSVLGLPVPYVRVGRWEEARVDRRQLAPAMLPEARLDFFVRPSFWLCLLERLLLPFPPLSRGGFLPLLSGPWVRPSLPLKDKGHRPRTTSASDIFEATVNSFGTPSTRISALSSRRMW